MSVLWSYVKLLSYREKGLQSNWVGFFLDICGKVGVNYLCEWLMLLGQKRSKVFRILLNSFCVVTQSSFSWNFSFIKNWSFVDSDLSGANDMFPLQPNINQKSFTISLSLSHITRIPKLIRLKNVNSTISINFYFYEGVKVLKISQNYFVSFFK